MGSSIHGIFVKKAPTLTVGWKYDRVVVERQSFRLWDQSFSHVAKSGEIQEDIGHHRLCQS